MALQKQGIDLNFAQGLDTKTDPKQVQFGKFLSLVNSQFKDGSGLSKRNGFGDVTTLPNLLQTTLTTLNDNLIATGSNLYAYSSATDEWLNKGTVQPVNLETQTLVSNSTSQTGADCAVTADDLICTVYMDGGVGYYQVSDANTGQQIVQRTQLAATATNPRVFLLNRFFIITFGATVTGTPNLRYIAVPISTPTSPIAAVSISTQFSSISGAYDAAVANNKLYIAWNGSDGGGAVRITSLSSTLVIANTVIHATYVANLMSVTADMSGNTPVIYYSWWRDSSNQIYTTSTNQILVQVLAPTLVTTPGEITELTSIANNGMLQLFYQVTNTYSFSSVRTDYIRNITVTNLGVVGTSSVVIRSSGLASKPFYSDDGIIYLLIAYGQAFQPTYFLIDADGNIVAKLAYSNGGGYASSQVLPSVTKVSDLYYIPYLFKDFLVSVNKEQGATFAGGIYTQTGIKLAKFELDSAVQYGAEIANTLHLTGGILWMYDSVKPVEDGFNVWPEDILATTSAAGGLITAQQYYYIFCYEWTDAQGNLHRSAPSIPTGVLTTGATSTNTINVPTLRLTYKDGQNPVRLVGYRWSTAQQLYYQFTSVVNPTVNDPTIDSIAIVDTLADSSILGNTLLYTTGGVIENIAPPASVDNTLFKSRMFLIDAEDPNLLWYSKQVIQTTPVEFSDLLTIFVAPTSGAQGSTGPMRALSAMDDKLIIFKDNALYYITGNGPDNTGANNDFSEPTFITGTVGCSNSKSIVFTPIGIMFQSDKGIWLLGRDLSTKYIGAAVESYNDDLAVAALSIPGTNQVRFALASGLVLMYDYYFDQWGTFENTPQISSTLWQNKHTFLNALGQIRQETPDIYLDGTSPVLLKFTTSWFKLTNLQGFQRAYCMYLLATYLSPHKLNVGIAYDYNPSHQQTTLISPDNLNQNWGDDTLYGGSTPWGGPSDHEQWRVFLNKQKCQSFQVTIEEVFDASKGQPAGAGFQMSGINLLIGSKGTTPKLNASQSRS